MGRNPFLVRHGTGHDSKVISRHRRLATAGIGWVWAVKWAVTQPAGWPEFWIENSEIESPGNDVTALALEAAEQVTDPKTRALATEHAKQVREAMR